MPIRPDAITATLSARPGSIPRMRRVAVAAFASASRPAACRAGEVVVRHPRRRVRPRHRAEPVRRRRLRAARVRLQDDRRPLLPGHAGWRPCRPRRRSACCCESASAPSFSGAQRRERPHAGSREDLLGRARGRQQRRAAQPGRAQARDVRRHAARHRRRAAAAQRPGRQRRAQRPATAARSSSVPACSAACSAINAVGLEDYVRGVVSAESPAVVARGGAGGAGGRRALVRDHDRRRHRQRRLHRPIPTRARRCTAASRPSTPRPTPPCAARADRS